jgi:chemotaxis signal transduction protein
MDILVVTVNNKRYGIDMRNVAYVEQDGSKMYMMGKNACSSTSMYITGLAIYRTTILKILSLDKFLNTDKGKFTSKKVDLAIDWKVRNKSLIVCECGEFSMAFEIDSLEDVINVKDCEIKAMTFDKKKYTYKLNCLDTFLNKNLVDEIEMIDIETIIKMNW